MSFFAYEDENHTQKIEWNEVITPQQRKADYYCPGCNCVFRYRAASSNGRRPHFYRYKGQHDPSCWVPTNDVAESGDLEVYNLDGYSTEQLLDAIKRSKEKPQKKSGKGKKHAGSELHKIKPSTIRQLYRICCENSDDTILPDGMSIRDIFCGRKTEYFYVAYRPGPGVKLVEARFYGYDKDTLRIFFQYPYRKEKQKKTILRISVEFPNRYVFNEMVRSLLSETNPILIFADWSDSFSGSTLYTRLESTKQIVPLKG